MTRKKKFQRMSIMWVVMFCIMFCTPFLTYPFMQKIVIEERNIESRTKAERPVLRRGNYTDYPQLFTRYFSDNMPYRDLLIRLSSNIIYNIFRESPSDKVIVGKEGWLFFECTLAGYKRINTLEQEKLDTLCQKLEAAQRYFDERGIEFLLTIEPDKVNIYGDDYLPDGIIRKDGLSQTEQILSYLGENADLCIVYPKETLLRAKAEHPEYPLYFHTDTHWNYLGGYYGAKEILQRLNISLPEFEELTLQQVNEPLFSWTGYDLENMMGMTGILHDKDINYEVIGYTDNDLTNWRELRQDRDDYNDTYRIVNPDARDDRKVMLIRDSFGSCLLPYLATQFREVYSPKYEVYSESEIDIEQPDIIIYESVERDITWRMDVLPE